MAQAFPGPYVDQSLTQRGPFTQDADAGNNVLNVRDLGPDRSYINERADVYNADLSSQEEAPKPFPGTVSFQVGYDPYANGGGILTHFNNSGA
jgi:hypothetical protein